MSNKTVRMSMDEKRRAILAIYHNTKEVYTEKEIINLASKAGVNQNTIAEINQSLCDDGLVDKDKIGGSNYYWSFPAKKDRLLQLEHDEVMNKIETLRRNIKDAEARLADAKRGREDDDDGDEVGGRGVVAVVEDGTSCGTPRADECRQYRAREIAPERSEGGCESREGIRSGQGGGASMDG
ncbi:hypothetical protein ACHAXA_011665 [Cyclostephanos tholiformis]|uniref:Mnd1 HTH domain-containing protein n=1 Tax=Cyclostephanos tholiformis TaxID=382380 RepID=A0ABD3SEI2_9STRA